MTASSLHRAEPAGILPGFDDATVAAQSVFRSVLLATSYPGRCQDLNIALDAPAPLNAATGAICLAMLDYETPVWLDAASATPAVIEWLRFHCGVPVVAAAKDARFAIIADPSTLASLDEFEIGDSEYPDRSATLIIQVSSLSGSDRRRWRGPGIKGQAEVGVDDIPEHVWHQREDQRILYPCGVDVYFTSGVALMGLPRTVQVEV